MRTSWFARPWTKELCNTIAASIARYEKYRCWASKLQGGEQEILRRTPWPFVLNLWKVDGCMSSCRVYSKESPCVHRQRAPQNWQARPTPSKLWLVQHTIWCSALHTNNTSWNHLTCQEACLDYIKGLQEGIALGFSLLCSTWRVGLPTLQHKTVFTNNMWYTRTHIYIYILQIHKSVQDVPFLESKICPIFPLFFLYCFSLFLQGEWNF